MAKKRHYLKVVRTVYSYEVSLLERAEMAEQGTDEKEEVVFVYPEGDTPDFTKFEVPFAIHEADEGEYECFVGNPPLVKESMHICKESAYDTGDRLGLTDKQIEKLITALYEVNFEVDVSTGEIVTVNGRHLEAGQGQS